jgi:hypothetical protein
MKAVLTERFGDYALIIKDPSYEKIKEVSNIVCALLNIEVREMMR